MAYDLNNFVIDRVVRAVAFDQDHYDKVLFSINQVTNPSLNVTSETAAKSSNSQSSGSPYSS